MDVFNLQASIELDLKNFEDEMGKVEKDAEKAKKEIDDFQEELDKTGAVAKETAAQQKALDIQVKSLAAQHEKSQREVEELRKQLIETAEATGENSEETAKLASELSRAESQASRTEKEMSQLKNELDRLSGETSDNEKHMHDLEKAQKELDKSTSEISGGFTVLKGVLVNLATEGVDKVVNAFDELMTSGSEALNILQTRTGMANDEIAEFEEQMKDLYKANYGESMEDIADVMSTVSQSFKETDPSKVKELARDAVVLRDTFGFDINESVRTANMLVTQFGTSGREAFNLIAQGAQNGLDKNGDLLDTINEYAVHYNQLDYTAEEFFNSLKNGADAGTFSVDKLGDAMKEFGIRTKDGSKTTTEAFISIGVASSDNSEAIEKAREEIDDYAEKIKDLEKKIEYARIEQSEFTDKTKELTKIKTADNIAEWTEEIQKFESKIEETDKILKDLEKSSAQSGKSPSDVFKDFAEGGETARKATKEVMDALLSMEDKVAQDAAGVALFGTMWEDLGVQGIEALMNVNGEADRTVETMDEINSIRYGDLSSEIGNLGRTIKVEILQPVADVLIPKVSEFVNWIKNNLPTVTALIAGVGAAMATLFVANKIMALVAAFQAYKTVTEGATVAQWLLNVAMNANPVGIIIALIAGLVAAFATLWATSEDFRNFWINLWEKIKSVTSDVAEKVKNGLTGAWETVKTKTSEIVTAVKDGVKGAVDAALTWGKDLIDNFVQGIKDNIYKVKEKVAEMAQTVKDYIGFSEPKRGVLSNFHTFSPDMVDLFVKGIDENQYKLINSVRGMAANVRNSLDVNANSPDFAFSSGSTGTISGGIVQNISVNLNIEGGDISENIDTITDRAVEQIAYKLRMLEISNKRALGGTGW